MTYMYSSWNVRIRIILHIHRHSYVMHINVINITRTITKIYQVDHKLRLITRRIKKEERL